METSTYRNGISNKKLILKNLETVQGKIKVGCDQPIICNTVVETKKYKPTNDIIWSIQDNQDENTENHTITNALKSTINSCHSKLFSANSIVGTKAQNDIMRILCIKLLEEQFNDKDSEIYKKCLEQKLKLQEDDYNVYLSYCKDLNNLIKKDNVFEEWEFLVNNFMVHMLPSIYDEQDSKFNCTSVNCIVNIIKDINKLEINQAFKDSFSTACGDIHEAFRAYSGGKGAKELGQFFTPRHLIHLMFHSLRLDNMVKEDKSIYDPCMGTGGFLTRMFKLANIESKNIYGCETELDTIKFGYMSLYLTTKKCEHNIKKCNSLCENDFIQTKKFDSIITNPPFGTKMKYKDLQKTYTDKYPTSDIKFSDIYPRKVNNGACLFIQHCVFMLNKNGFCAIVLPDGELFEGNSKWSKTFRKWWCTNVNIRTILKVASGTFEHAGVKTNVVIFTNDGPTQNIKFMETSKECNEVKELFTITKNDLQSTEYSLDVGEYLEETNENYNCPMVELKQLFNIKYGDKNPSTKCIGQKFPNISGGSKISKYTDEWNIKENTILIARSGSCGSVNMFNEKCLMGSYGFCLDPLTDDLNINYIYSILKFNQSDIEKLGRGTAVKNLNRDKLYSHKIPLPSTEIQQEIINELSTVENSIKTIETRVKQIKIEKEQYKKYKRKSEIRGLLSDCERVALGDICEINSGTRIVKKNNTTGQYPVYGSGNESFTTNTFNRSGENIIIGRFALSERCVRIIKGNFYLNDSGLTVNSDNMLIQKYIGLYLLFNQDIIYNISRGQAQRNLNMEKLKKLKIPLPSPEIQQQCITIFEQKEQYLNQLDEKINKEKEYMKELKSLGKEIISTFCG